VKTFQTIDELEIFLLKHGENIVDLMGGEIDRIEMKLRVSYMREYIVLIFLTFSFSFREIFFFQSRKNSPKFVTVI
jgi:hypothetical protein